MRPAGATLSIPPLNDADIVRPRAFTRICGQALSCRARTALALDALRVRGPRPTDEKAGAPRMSGRVAKIVVPGNHTGDALWRR